MSCDRTVLTALFGRVHSPLISSPMTAAYPTQSQRTRMNWPLVVWAASQSKEVLQWKFVLAGEAVELKTIGHPKFVVAAGDVLLDGVFHNSKKLSDVFVRHTMPYNP